MKGKVVVGMSGGVDSSVAAYLLKQQGYDVIGVTMEIWQDEDVAVQEENGGCCGLSAVEDARRVSNVIGIPHYVMNFREVFKEKVIEDFVCEYRQGHTPNPCIRCNRYVKWEALLKRSMDIGADFIATGHYANVVKLSNGRFSLKKAANRKDQTYALYNLSQYQLEHTLMPCGGFTKDEIREIAKLNELPVFNKPDSQDICFVPDGNYAAFIEQYDNVVIPEGYFVDMDGNPLGMHKGITHYTIGQRKGLNLAMGKPVFVVDIIPETNQVVIGSNDDIMSTTVIADDVNLMSIETIDGKIEVIAKIRYNHSGDKALAYIDDKGRLVCEFEKPVRAATKGQSLVLYDGDIVVGGGRIVEYR